MLDRQKTILSSAAQVFSRYGVKRATMNDIAAEAGVARQTLYNAFANKDAILRALIENHIEETCASISEHLASNGSLEDGLEIAFDHFARKPYEILRSTPHGGEMMESLENAASEEMKVSTQRFGEAMVMMLAPHVENNPAATISTDELADFIVHTTMGHKAKASSAEHLEGLLKTLKKLILQTVRSA